MAIQWRTARVISPTRYSVKAKAGAAMSESVPSKTMNANMAMNKPIAIRMSTLAHRSNAVRTTVPFPWEVCRF